MELNGRVVVITGGGSGIGEALARAAAGAGARHVVVADLNAAEAGRVAADIGGTPIEIDVSEEEQVNGLVERVEADYGPVDLFCSNAGFVTTAGLEESNETIQAMWEVHVLSHVYAARAAIPSMIARGEGYLLNTASAAGLLTQVGSMAYAITKHAAVALAEWLAITHHHQGIRVSVLCPQAVRTNIVTNSPSYRPTTDTSGLGVAAVDGILEAGEVATLCLDAIAEERFWVLPHPEVASYVKRKADDIDRWLAGMRRFQANLYSDAPLPGDAIAPGHPAG
jgi:NAD(P)-dependent dehydrogenase (short-subunit alcohol dehydrogenase family)